VGFLVLRVPQATNLGTLSRKEGTLMPAGIIRKLATVIGDRTSRAKRLNVQSKAFHHTRGGDDQKQDEGPARARRGGGMTDPGLILLIGLALVMIVTAVSTKLPR
jgi:hypothetical protein